MISTLYHPVWSDEFFYFVNTNSYVKNNSLKAALTYNGDGSLVFGADAHGFGYPLLHGIIADVFGWGNLNLVYFNLAIVFVAIVFVWLINSFRVDQKIWISFMVLSFPFFQLYGFTYMQESLHVFIAIILSVLLYNIYNKSENLLYFQLFLIVIFISGFFRGLWFFWLIGLIPLAKSKKQLKLYLLLFFIGILISLVFMKLFFEPVPNYFSSVINLLQKGEVINALSSLIDHFFYNINMYFFNNEKGLIYTSIKYINIGSIVFFIYDAIKNKEKLSIAIALIGGLNFLLLFVLYDAFDWREIRSMSPVFYFCILFLILKMKVYIRYSIVIFLLFLFVKNIDQTTKWIQERNNFGASFVEEEHKAYQKITINVKDKPVILMNYTPRDYSWDLLNLPLQTSNKLPIRYIVPYYKVNNFICNYHIIRPNRNGINNKIIDNQYYILSKNNN